MSLTDRDRKVVLVLIPILLLLGFWFLVLAPKRAESAKVAAKLPAARTAAESSQAKQARLEGSRARFSADYSELIRLGKAVPPSLDMPSLIVQLDEAARSTGIKFISITRSEAAATVAPVTPAAPAESGPGQTAQGAEEGVAAAQPAAPAEDPAAAGETAPPADGSAPPAGQVAAPAPPPGLQTVPLELTFSGGFFELADLLHRLKRFVRVANDRVVVKGRLMTVEGLKFETADTDELKVTLNASIYVVPREQGVTAGATPSGPSGAPPVAPTGATASVTPPTAAVAP